MKKNIFKLSVILIALTIIIPFIGIQAYAKEYSGADVVPGLKIIKPGDTIIFPENTIKANLTAIWGVRVKFIDWDGKEIKSELLEVTDTEKANTTTPADPTRDGYNFIGWKRNDTNTGLASLNKEDGSVTDIVGPGPIVFIATYEVKTPSKLKVMYSVKKNATWGEPDESLVPEDNNVYEYNDNVKVLLGMAPIRGYAVDQTSGKKVAGTWTFNLLNSQGIEIKENNEFNITEDTEIDGTWEFTPDKLKVMYKNKKDATWGEPDESIMPEEINAEDDNIYDYNDNVKVLRKMTSFRGVATDPENGKQVAGTWAFNILNSQGVDIKENNEFNIIEDTEIDGEWEFTPDKLKVTYNAKENEKWGTPDESMIPEDYNLYDYKSNVDVINNKEPIKGYAIDKKTGKKVEGEWRFVLASNEENFQITEDTELEGHWEFTPTSEKKNNTPETGDNIYIYIVLIIVATVGMIFTIKRVKKNKVK